jgi:hypothetical protein
MIWILYLMLFSLAGGLKSNLTVFKRASLHNVMASLHTLSEVRLDNRNLRELPLDTIAENYVRVRSRSLLPPTALPALCFFCSNLSDFSLHSGTDRSWCDILQGCADTMQESRGRCRERGCPSKHRAATGRGAEAGVCRVLQWQQAI